MRKPNSRELLAGAASRSIVPTRDIVEKNRHFIMSVRFDERGSPLNAKALALSLGRRRFVIIALDIVAVNKAHCDLMRQAIANRIGLDASEIVISASHTHSTPYFEPLDGPRPYFDLVCRQSLTAAEEAWKSRRPARFGRGVTHVVGASFNRRVPLPDGGVKFARDFREGLASGQPIDPRLSIIRIDDETGKPIAGWVSFPTHPACVIFDAPLSGEYPSYLTERLSETAAGGAPVLFGYAAGADTNCIPMFGKESDARDLGLQMARLAAPVFEHMETRVPKRFLVGSRTIEVPLDPPPSAETFDEEIKEVNTFIEALDQNPELTRVLSTNCGENWTVEEKIKYTRPLVTWAELVKRELKSGRKFPTMWPTEIVVLIVDDLGLAFYPGEAFTQLGLRLAARSPLKETLLISNSNGRFAYIGTDEDRRRKGYEMYTVVRYFGLKKDCRPLPYALGAAEYLLGHYVSLIGELCGGETR